MLRYGPDQSPEQARPEPTGPKTDIELKGSYCTMSPNPKWKEDEMPNQTDRHRTTLEYVIDYFTRIACTTLSTPHAHATSGGRLTG